MCVCLIIDIFIYFLPVTSYQLPSSVPVTWYNEPKRRLVTYLILTFFSFFFSLFHFFNYQKETQALYQTVTLRMEESTIK